MSYASRIKVRKIPSGGTALYCAFPSHGMFSVVGSITGGGRLAGDDMLANIHASMLLDGTKEHSKTAIQEQLDACGASLSFAVERDRLTFSVHVRNAFAKKTLALAAEALISPSFPKAELEYLKERMRASLSLEAQDTRTQASINLSRILFKPGHPNYQMSTAESLAALEGITRDALLAYHARAISRRTLVVAGSGDMKPLEAFSMLEKAFSKLPDPEIALPAFEASQPIPPQSSSVTIADKASIDYMIGIATGITRNHTEYPAFVLGLQILGNRSGFTGRLMQTVREIEGLTYGAYAYPAGFSNADGYVNVWATFAPALFARGKAALMREITKIVTEGATPEDVKKHQRMFEARSRVTLSNSGDLARAAHDVIISGNKPSYLDEFPQTILKLTPRQVNDALKKYLLLDRLSDSAAGPTDIGA